MTTPVMDRPVQTEAAPRTSRRWVGMVLAAVLLVGAGIAVGWAVRGDDDSPAPVYVGLGGAIVGSGELTDRQWDMVDVAQQYVDAWVAEDGEAVASFMTPDGSVVMPGLGQTVYVSDGSLQEWVGGLGIIPTEMGEPMEVLDDTVVVRGFSDGLSADWMIVLQFTESGDVKIVSDTHYAF